MLPRPQFAAGVACLAVLVVCAALLVPGASADTPPLDAHGDRTYPVASSTSLVDGVLVSPVDALGTFAAYIQEDAGTPMPSAGTHGNRFIAFRDQATLEEVHEMVGPPAAEYYPQAHWTVTYWQDGIEQWGCTAAGKPAGVSDWCRDRPRDTKELLGGAVLAHDVLPDGCTLSGRACQSAHLEMRVHDGGRPRWPNGTPRVPEPPSSVYVATNYHPASDTRAEEAVITFRNAHATEPALGLVFHWGHTFHLSDGAAPCYAVNNACDGVAPNGVGWGSFISIGTQQPVPDALLFSSTAPRTWVASVAPSNYPMFICATATGENYAYLPPRLGPGSESEALGGGALDMAGPCDHQGLNIKLDLGDLAPGESRTFRMYFGSGEDHAEAMDLVDALGAQIWGIADPPPPFEDDRRGPDARPGNHAAFMVGFSGFPTADFAAPLTVCAFDPAAFTDTSTPGDTFAPVRSVWSWGDGTSEAFDPWQPSVSHSYSALGTYWPSLTFTDSNGLTATRSAEVPVTVIDCDVPPLATIVSASSPGTCVDTRVHFIASASDPDGGALSFSWDFGDGATSTELHPTHQYTTAGPVQVRLTVTDDDTFGPRSTTSAPLSWNAVPDWNCLPELTVLPQYQMRFQGATFVVTATVLDDDSVPVLSLLGGPVGASFVDGVFTWPTGSETRAGLYTITIRATDGEDIVERNAQLRVLPLPPKPPGSPPDWDADGVWDGADNCPTYTNHDQQTSCGTHQTAGTAQTGPSGAEWLDFDRDGIADLVDNCPGIPNRDQENLDGDTAGDACDPDLDGDGIPQQGDGLADNCIFLANPKQEDRNGDGHGDACQGVVLASPGAVPPSAAVSGRQRGLSAGDATPSWALPLGLVVGLAGLWALLSRTRGAPLVVLFSRLRKSDLAAHPVRAELLAVIEAEPGIHFQALLRRVQRSRGQVDHHLRILEKVGLVALSKTTGYNCYFVPGGGQFAAAAAAPFTRTDLARRLLDAIAAAPGHSVTEVTQAVGGTHGAVGYHLHRLEAAGLIRLEKQGRRLCAFPVGA